MSLKSLIAEFEHEVNSTRKLLNAVPEKDISYKPSPVSWTMGELAQHIATIYYWYTGTLTQDNYDINADTFDRGEPSDIRATIDMFEKNVILARKALAKLSERQGGDGRRAG